MKLLTRLLLVLIVAPLLTSQTHDGHWGNIRPIGAIHSHSGGVTNNTSGTPIKIVGTFALTGVEAAFGEPVEGRLQYTGDKTRTIICHVHFSFTSDKNNKILTLSIAKNGSVETDSQISTKIATGTDVKVLSTSLLVSLDTNDYLEAFIDSDSGDPAITTQHITIMAWALEL